MTVAMIEESAARISELRRASKASGELKSSIYQRRLIPSKFAVLFAELKEKSMSVRIGI